MRVLAWVLPLWALPLAAGPAAAAGGAELWGGGLTEIKLDNGLRIAVLERHATPIVYLHFRVFAGSAQEPEGWAGLSRLVDRNFLNGSETLGSRNPAQEKAALEAAEKALAMAPRGTTARERIASQDAEAEAKMLLAKAGALGSRMYFEDVLNENGASGYTSVLNTDSSDYSVSMPAERAELLFRMWGEWLRHPSWRFFYDDRADMKEMLLRRSMQGVAPIASQFYGALFEGHPYAKLGAPMSEFERARVSEAKTFFARYYRPGNIAIAVVGDVTPAEVRAWAEAHLAAVPAGEAAARPREAGKAKGDGAGKTRRTAIRASANPQIWMAWRRPPANATTAAGRYLARQWLAGGPQSWLELRQQETPALLRHQVQESPTDAIEDALVLLLLPASGVSLEALEQASRSMLAGVAGAEIRPEALIPLKKRARAQILRQFEDPERCSTLLTRAIQEYGSTAALGEMLAAIEAAKPEAIRAALEETVMREPDVIATISPVAAAPAAGQAGGGRQ
ncbi:MAG: insulinase family protein [Bryobacteraceae bacterium]